MRNPINRVAWTAVAAGLLAAVAMVAGSCSSSGPAPTPQPETATSSAATPAPAGGAMLPPDPPRASAFAPDKARTPPRSQLPPTPTNTAPAKKVIAPNDFKGLANEYGGEIMILDEENLAIINGKLAPSFKLTITNGSQRAVNRLLIRCTVKGGSIYSDDQTISPLTDAAGATKVLAAGAKITYDLKCKSMAVTQQQQDALSRTQAQAQFFVVELGFAN